MKWAFLIFIYSALSCSAIVGYQLEYLNNHDNLPASAHDNGNQSCTAHKHLFEHADYTMDYCQQEDPEIYIPFSPAIKIYATLSPQSSLVYIFHPPEIRL